MYLDIYVTDIFTDGQAKEFLRIGIHSRIGR